MAKHDIDWPQVLGPDLCGLDRSSLSALEDALWQRSPRALRLPKPDEFKRLPFESVPVPWYPSGRLVGGDIRPGAFLHHAAADYYVQDAGSMLALAACQIEPGQRVCDACAAPGGKSTGILDQLEGRGLLVANEAIASRVSLLQQLLTRTGHNNYAVTHLDLERMVQRFGSVFDCVLVDAPCSGQSMVRRGKQSMAAFSDAQIHHSSARQHRILDAACRLVRPGGRLVYATCTFSFAENEAAIGDFSRRTGWQPYRIPDLHRWESSSHSACYRLWPHRDPCDGAFVAVLRKTSSEATPARPNETSKNRGQSQQWQPMLRVPEDCPWLPPNALEMFERDRELHGFSAAEICHPDSDFRSFLPLARHKAGRWEPVYGAAKWLGRQPPREELCIELSDELACRYVAGEALRIDNAGQSGWRLISWRGRTLGWGKHLQGMLKNHFPKAFRQSAVVRPSD